MHAQIPFSSKLLVTTIIETTAHTHFRRDFFCEPDVSPLSFASRRHKVDKHRPTATLFAKRSSSPQTKESSHSSLTCRSVVQDTHPGL